MPQDDEKDFAAIERIKVDASEGTFMLYDATGPAAVRDGQTGQFAYRRFLGDEEVYIYQRALFSLPDVGLALMDLEQEFGVDVAAIAQTHPALQQALRLAQRGASGEPTGRADDGTGQAGDSAGGDGTWRLVNAKRLRSVVGLPRGSAQVSDSFDTPVRNLPWPPPKEPCAPYKGILPPPAEKANGAGFLESYVETPLIAIRRCGGCAGECCGSSDPCCGSSDPCCGSSNPCCLDPECCGDTECCLDRCCQGSECCGSTDPCCDTESPCCGNPDPCCNPDNPDCGQCEAACCNNVNPCCNDPCCGDVACCKDRCCQGSPCCGSDDPCCDPGSPCCGNPDPCCHPDNPDCGVEEVACANSADPCCNGPCDDDNPCTTDTCDSLTGECTNECPASLVASGSSCPLAVTLKEITFLGGIPIRSEAPPCEAAHSKRCWGDDGVPVGPHWKAKRNPDRAAAYVRGTPMALEVKMAVRGGVDGTAQLRVTGWDGLIGNVPFQVGGCEEVDQVVTITTGPLPNVVKAYTRLSLTWTVDPPLVAPTLRIGNTAHFVYVTLGPPSGASFVTQRRLNFVCNAAAQAGTALEAIEGALYGGPGIHAALDANPPNDGCPEGTPPGECVDDWSLMASWPYRGECDEQARFMNLAMQMVGVPEGSEYETYASTDGNVRTPDSKMENGKKWWLKFDFDDDGEVDNNFEGSLTAGGRSYAVWPSLKASSECRLLRQVGPDDFGATQRWVRTELDVFGGDFLEHLPGVEAYPSCP